MKTLKKVLSLVLVVAMIASMLIVGAAATEETQYPEAAAVISGIKVMEGDERGMRYTDVVTREEAAAIICRLLLGDTSATLKTTTAPFADVAASRWSAGYIAYLKAQGIVSGVTDTEFDPTAPVTGIAFAKMLLTAVGYGKAGEFEGAAWDINTITLANEKRLFADAKTADLAAGATREECMLYAFNTLLVPAVKYNKTFESYYVGESAITPAVGAAQLAYTLAATRFALTPDYSVTDYFGRPAVNYTLAGEPLASRVVLGAPKFTAENTLTGAALYAKLGAAAVAKLEKIVVWTDGVKDDTTYASQTAIAAVVNQAATRAAVGATAQGAHIEAYLNEAGTELTLVVYYEYLGTATAINPITGLVTVDGYIGAIEGAVAGVSTYVYTKSDMPAALTELTTNIFSAEAAVPTIGTYQKTNSLGQYVIDGVACKASNKYEVVAGVHYLPTVYGQQYTIYTDSLGNILMAAPYNATVTSRDYLYVQEAHVVPANASLASGTALTAKLRVVYANGGKADVNYTLGVNAQGQPTMTLPGVALPVAVTTENLAAINAALATGWYSYITAEDGSVTLVDNMTEVTGLGVTKGKLDVAGFANKWANSATVLNVVNQNGILTETYTGIANFPTTIVSGVANNSYIVMIDVIPYTNTIAAINVYGVDPELATPVPTVGYVAEYLFQDYYGWHFTLAVNGAVSEIIVPTASIVDADAAAAMKGTVYNVTPNAIYGYTLDSAVAYDAPTFDPTLLKYTDNIIASVDSGYIVIANADGTGAAPMYYNVFGYAPTYVIDLAAGGTIGTLTAGRAITYVEAAAGIASYIFMH